VNLATVAEFGSREEAEQAVAVLRRAGIPWAVQESASRFELRVAEGYVNDARQYLLMENQPSALNSGRAGLACPECGGFETRRVPGYTLIVWLVCISAAVVLFAFHQLAFVLPALIFGSLVALWAGRFAGKWRCSKCGWVFLP